MKSNKLISYKENIFTKISNFFKKIFLKNKNVDQEENIDNSSNNKQDEEKESFLKNIIVIQDEEQKRIQEIKAKYDNEEIDEDDISDEDMDKLIEMYEKETEELNRNTEIRKNHIAQMLKELKNSY